MQENTDLKNSEYRYFSRSETGTKLPHFVGLIAHVYIYFYLSATIIGLMLQEWHTSKDFATLHLMLLMQ